MDNIQVFDGIKEESKIKIRKLLNSKILNKNEILFNERDNLEKLFFLKDGKISVFKMSESGERKIIFILNKGEMINELLIDGIKTSSIGCEAFEKSIILECNAEDFIKVMEDDLRLTKNILVHIQNRNRRLYRQVKNSISIRIDKKLAAKLYRMGKEFGVKKGQWTFLNVNLTITYIAEMLGCKRETLSRAMKILQDEDLVKLEGKKVYIRMEGLSKYFKGM
ncbi:Crp/Fnr family transcriptional regulator [Romboutsia sp. CE17]|uniref:Crp/Fnr family transcriptional regulator n=1 Tax=Romboutsia sp. CE17 TaxID=2724150 RepID=UPI001442DF34|nr:Crp/Fnr family transcriptional regulator [Romboutsia sp. CE17]QJA09106.1 Crp/Fnr family transcriptional regulator [Romboutsia sp. CE17]